MVVDLKAVYWWRMLVFWWNILLIFLLYIPTLCISILSLPKLKVEKLWQNVLFGSVLNIILLSFYVRMNSKHSVNDTFLIDFHHIDVWLCYLICHLSLSNTFVLCSLHWSTCKHWSTSSLFSFQNMYLHVQPQSEDLCSFRRDLKQTKS